MSKQKARKSANLSAPSRKKESSLTPPAIAVQRTSAAELNTSVPMPEYTPLANDAADNHPLLRQFQSVQPIQTKLTIGEVGDKYEQEADRVARDVVREINAPAIAQREENEKKIARKLMVQRDSIMAKETASQDIESSINRAKGGGQSLDRTVQSSMGEAMGADFSRVRVHTDSNADRLNRSLQAKAFTTGQDVFFRQGAYQPESRGGQELLAHELTHVVQQSTALRRQGDESEKSQKPTLIVENSVQELSRGQMRQSEFLEKLYQKLHKVGTEEYQGTNLTVDGCPYIEYWFARYRQKSSSHIEEALRKYVSESSGMESVEQLIELICERARTGFKKQVKSGEITELPSDVPEEVGKDIVPTKETIVQQKIEDGASYRAESLSLTQPANALSQAVIQRGCIFGNNNGNGGNGAVPQQPPQPRGTTLQDLWGLPESNPVYRGLDKNFHNNFNKIGPIREGGWSEWNQGDGNTLIWTSPLLSCAAVYFIYGPLNNPNRIVLNHATGSIITMQEIQPHRTANHIIMISSSLESGKAENTVNDIRYGFNQLGINGNLRVLAGSGCATITSDGRVGMGIMW